MRKRLEGKAVAGVSPPMGVVVKRGVYRRKIVASKDIRWTAVMLM